MKFNLIYFPHDVNARSDFKIRALEAAVGVNVGYGMYFKLLEVLAQSNGVIDINSDIRRQALAYELGCDSEGLESFLDTCAELNLIAAHRYKDGRITSEGFSARVQDMQKRLQAAENGAKLNAERQRRHRERLKEAKANIST